MPTGYTSKMYEGKPQTFPEFAMSCARNFGALIMMRDDAPDAEIPDEFEPSDYHVRELAKAKAEWARLTGLNVEQAQAESRVEWDAFMAERRRAEQSRAAMRDRYEAMLAEARAWTPPTADHKGLKKFMVEQLEDSIRFDCGMDYYPSPPPMGDEWRQAKIEKAERDIAYHTTEQAREVERAKGRTEWVQALRSSLPAEVR